MLDCSAILENSLSQDSDEQDALNSDTVAAVITFILVANVVCCMPLDQTPRQDPNVDQVIKEIAVRLRNRIQQDKGVAMAPEGLLRPFSFLHGNLDFIIHEDNALAKGLLKTTLHFNASFWTILWERLKSEQSNIDDAMDLDDGFESQGSRQFVMERVQSIPHNEYLASTNAGAFKASTIAAVVLCSLVNQSSLSKGEISAKDPSTIVEYLVSLDAHEFLSAKAILIELMNSRYKTSTQDVASCLEYVAQELLQSYDYERCEVSLGLCLDIMTGFSAFWTDPIMSEVADLGSNLYEWFIKVALQREISSPHVHICMSSMLQQLIKIRPQYAHTLSLESARTSLFHVLRDGNLVVKFSVGKSISEIFGLFVLKEHDNILEDVIHTLPEDSGWIEGIALRLYVLAHLGAAWPTLLRRSVYAIFETPQHVPEALKHAGYCLDYIAKTLCLPSTRSLFYLFAAQIVYTWSDTEDQSMTSMPYKIFGYGSIAALFDHVKDEIMGQIVMRGKYEEAMEVANILKVPLEDLLEASFSKAAAYSIARDISMPPIRNSQVPGAESRLRTMVGKEVYNSLVVRYFPEILSLLYRRMDQEAHILKGFEKHPLFEGPRATYDKMRSISSSDQAVPVNQQPSFKAGYLVDIVAHLCRRTHYEAESIWTAPLYIYILRELLNDLHKALGSLHACSVIRRVRILIAMAGSAALENYAIEMTLHALRPYLADVHCADDALGMMQYLVEAGSMYLQRVPSFITGFAVLTLTSVKQFLGSSQDSTTQESQFRSTISKASSFHIWFAEYLRRYDSPELSEDTKRSFSKMINAASNIRASGNARNGTYESDLLLEILEVEVNGWRLLTTTSRKSILQFLCTDFEHPPATHEDVLESEERTLTYAPSVWSICRQIRCSDNFLLWAGRLLGRAYAMTGSVIRCLHSDVRDMPIASSNTVSPILQSVSTIVSALSDLLDDEDPAANGAAEMTLRSIIASADAKDQSFDYKSQVSQAVLEGLTWTDYERPRSQIECEEKLDLVSSLRLEKITSTSAWLRNICIAMASTLADCPLVSKLAAILYTVNGLANTIFPCILHLVLLEDRTQRRQIQPILTDGFHRLLGDNDHRYVEHRRALLQALLYLRQQPYPDETNKADRSQWLDINHGIAADAATRCSMFNAALLFLETTFSEAAKSSKRASDMHVEQPVEALIKIYTNIDEPDSFYGVQQPSSLASMKTRLEFEHAGFKSLSFSGAFFDSQIRFGEGGEQTSIEDMVQTLDNLSLHGISRSLFSDTSRGISADAIMRNARKLERWDISVPSTEESSINSVFRMFQGLNTATDRKQVTSVVDVAVLSCIKQLSFGRTSEQLRGSLSALVSCAEVDTVFSSGHSAESLQGAWNSLSARDEWMKFERYGLTTTLVLKLMTWQFRARKRDHVMSRNNF